MGKIIWTEEALRWLHDIHDYIASDNPDAADKIASGIYKKVQMLRRFPTLGYTYRRETEGCIRIILYVSLT